MIKGFNIIILLSVAGGGDEADMPRAAPQLQSNVEGEA